MRTSIILPENVFPGTILHDDLLLDPDVPLDRQLDDLKEDLLLVEFPEDFTLKVGWYPSFKASGDFLIQLSHHPESWEPFLRRRCRSITELREIVKELVRVASQA